ncbi:unnamed protein product [Blepharisma stoltei]|uniref:Uncharacterized protein n=1 Tax=Blepharisma stoltei TaxID=1481888 RepID=A0AAU9JLC7_9CILI|nr:unnamed protein product [Blepharisma stoltei]
MMENALVAEVHIITREYSTSRSNKNKWRVFRKTATPPPTSIIDYQPTSGEDMLAIIYQKKLDVVDGYLFSHLYKRLMLKRNEVLFKTFLSLWNLINPIKMPGISKKVYFSLYEIIYVEILNASTEEQSVKSMVLTDMKIDFGDSECLGLSDFYDGFFECLDTFTRSTLVIEYVRVLKQIHGHLLKSQWFNQLNLSGRLHYKEGAKPQYSPWMIQYFKPEESLFHKSSARSIPSLFKAPIGSVRISERLLKGSVFSREKSSGDILSKKIEMLINPKESRNLRSSNKPRTAGQNSFGNSSFKPKNRRLRSIEIDHLDVVSPLSIAIKKSRKNSSLLEEIIEGRRNYFRRVSSQSQLSD